MKRKKMYKKILSFDVGIRNLGICLVEYTYTPATTNANDTPQPWENLRVLHWECVDVLTETNSQNRNAKTVNINVLRHKLTQVLVGRLHLLKQHQNLQSTEHNVTNILVEQQPLVRKQKNKQNHRISSCGSPRLKVLQNTILLFYELYYRWVVSTNGGGTVPKIIPMSASNKLKCVLNENNLCTPVLTRTDKTLSYPQRKNRAVDYVKTIVRWCTISDDLKRKFAAAHKLDDYADSLLQCIYELQTSKPKPIKPPKVKARNDKGSDKHTPPKKRQRKDKN